MTEDLGHDDCTRCTGDDRLTAAQEGVVKALEFYANGDNWKCHHYDEVCECSSEATRDGGDDASVALKELEEASK